MAKRRMFMENLIESDEFCSLSHSAQALYFHLNMVADDDGIVGNPKRVLRSLKIPKKHYDALIESGFIISFDSGVIAVTHWLSNNSIKKDRYTPTRFKNEFSLLKIQDGAMYIKASSEICGDVSEQISSKNAPQVSIGKVSEAKDRVAELSVDEISLGEYSVAKKSAAKSREDEEREEKERIGCFLSEKEIEIEIEKTPSEEGESENDKSFSVSLSEKNKKDDISFLRERFISTVKLHIMTEYGTLDDKGFIEHYDKRAWLDEDNKPIALTYKSKVKEWMRLH